MPQTLPSLASLLDALQEPAVRDLAWLLFSANLLRAQPPVAPIARPFDTPDEALATVRWLHALDAEPASLKRDLAARRITRLGRYAEQLLGWFLQYGPAARLVAAGVPVRRAGVTLGECDFLAQTQQGVRLHWELAVKCYLHAGDAPAPLHGATSSLPNRPAQPAPQAAAMHSPPLPHALSHYVGPNLKDRFDLKFAHLLNHQLPLSARDEFTALGYPGPWTPQMFVKGWLFYRDGATPSPLPAFEPILDPAHGRGWWVTRSDWPAFAHRHAFAWRVLPRLAWLAPGRVDARTSFAAEQPVLVDGAVLAAQIAPEHGPTMVAGYEAARGGGGHWRERSRGFIVPDDWPERAVAYAGQ